MNDYTVTIYKYKQGENGYEKTNTLYPKQPSDEDAFKFMAAATAGGLNLLEDEWHRGDSNDDVVVYWNVDGGNCCDPNSYMVCLERAA